MNFYHFIETSLIALIGIVSAYHVVKLLMPRLIHAVRSSVAQRMDRGPKTGWRRKLAIRVRGIAPAGGCGTDCSSGCNNCALASHVHPPLARDDNSSN